MAVAGEHSCGAEVAFMVMVVIIFLLSSLVFRVPCARSLEIREPPREALHVEHLTIVQHKHSN